MEVRQPKQTPMQGDGGGAGKSRSQSRSRQAGSTKKLLHIDLLMLTNNKADGKSVTRPHFLIDVKEDDIDIDTVRSFELDLGRELLKMDNSKAMRYEYETKSLSPESSKNVFEVSVSAYRDAIHQLTCKQGLYPFIRCVELEKEKARELSQRKQDECNRDRDCELLKESGEHPRRLSVDWTASKDGNMWTELSLVTICPSDLSSFDKAALGSFDHHLRRAFSEDYIQNHRGNRECTAEDSSTEALTIHNVLSNILNDLTGEIGRFSSCSWKWFDSPQGVSNQPETTGIAFRSSRK